jgi:hypothetical protein
MGLKMNNLSFNKKFRIALILLAAFGFTSFIIDKFFNISIYFPMLVGCITEYILSTSNKNKLKE